MAFQIVDQLGQIIWHRQNVTGADTIALTGAARNTADSAGTLFPVQGARTVELRLWGGADGGNCLVTVVGWARRKPGDGPECPSPQGVILVTGTMTCGTSSLANISPIDGTPVASTTFYEAKLWTPVSGTDSGVGKTSLYDTFASDTSGNRQCRLQFDPAGLEDIFVYLTAFAGSIARVDVGLRRI